MPICDILVIAFGNWISPTFLVGTRTGLILSPSFTVTVADFHRVQTVWLQPKVDRLASFFQEFRLFS
jgi:hypothetical protein